MHSHLEYKGCHVYRSLYFAQNGTPFRLSWTGSWGPDATSATARLLARLRFLRYYPWLANLMDLATMETSEGTVRVWIWMEFCRAGVDLAGVTRCDWNVFKQTTLSIFQRWEDFLQYLSDNYFTQTDAIGSHVPLTEIWRSKFMGKHNSEIGFQTPTQ